MKSSTETIIGAMRILARDIQSDDGVANIAILEAADRLEEQQEEITELKKFIAEGKEVMATAETAMRDTLAGLKEMGEVIAQMKTETKNQQ
ncbi:MAG: hypothetical protein ACO3S0_16165 [bacterium]